MTCVIGITDGSTVWMTADSYGGEDNDYSLRRDRKLFRKPLRLITPSAYTPSFKPEMLIGFTSSYRMGQIIQYQADILYPTLANEYSFEWHRWMVTDFIEPVRLALKERGYSKVEHNQEEGGTFLVGIAGRLYTVYSDFQVEETHRTYAAIGSGAKFACGSLHTTEYQDADITPLARLRAAMEAAESHSPYVREPYLVEELVYEGG